MDSDENASARPPTLPPTPKPPDPNCPSSSPNDSSAALGHPPDLNTLSSSKHAPPKEDGETKASKQTGVSQPPSGSLGTSLRLIQKGSMEMLIQLQDAYSSLADHFDRFDNNATHPHVKATLNIIAKVITDRATGAVSPAAGIHNQTAPPPVHISSPRDVYDTPVPHIQPTNKPPAPPPARPAEKKSYADAASQPTTRGPIPLPPKPPTVDKTGGIAQKRTKEKHGEDNRVMVRLTDHTFASKAPAAALLEKARSTVGPDLARKILSVQITKSGFALIPSDSLVSRKLLERGNDLKKAFEAKAVEPQVERDDFCVRHAPRKTLHLHDPMRDIEEAEYIQEIEATIGITPLSVYMRTYDSHETTGTMFLSFPAGKVRPGRQIMLFRSSLTLLRRNRKPRRVVQCRKCWEFDHGQEHCTRPELCCVCGSKGHTWAGHPIDTTDAESNVSRCTHCGGPHRADYEKCPLRPSRQNGTGRLVYPYPQEAKSIRKQQRKLRVESVAQFAEKSNKQEEHPGPAAVKVAGAALDDDNAMTDDPEPSIAPAPAPDRFWAPQSSTAMW